MTFPLSPEHESFRRMVRDFAEAEVAPHVAQWDRDHHFPVDLVRRIVKMGDREIKLSPKEYDMLRYFVHHAGKVLTHSNLLRELWPGSQDAQYLRVYVRQLRQKLETNPEQPSYITTETGVGYRFRAPDV